MKKRTLFGLGALLAVVVVIVVCWRQAGPTARIRSFTELSPAAQTVRRTDAARRLSMTLAKLLQAQGEVYRQTKLSKEQEYERLLNSAADVKAGVLQGDPKWAPTVLALEDSFFARDERRECARTFQDVLPERCDYKIDIVVERVDEHTGRIVSSRGRSAPDDPEPVCAAFAACIAAIREKKTIPIPADADTTFAISQSLQSTQLAAEMMDPAHVERGIAVAKAGIAAWRADAELAAPVKNYFLPFNDQFVKYLEGHLAELRGASGK